MQIYEFVKSRALRWLPEWILQPMKERHYLRTLRSFDEASEPDLQVVRHLVARGNTCVDLGANVGVYTMVLSDLVGSSGRVVSVEPIPPTFRILQSNVRRLGLENVTPINVAISDAAATVPMSVPNFDAGGGNFYQARIITADSTSDASAASLYYVQSATLDSIAESLGRIDFIKCDVEGHEEACLAGAIRVVSDSHPAWLVEIWGDPDDGDSNARRVFAFFESRGYTVWIFDGAHLRSRTKGVQSTNYFFLGADHIARIREQAPSLLTKSP